MIRDIDSPQVARDVARRVRRGRRALVVKSMKCPGGDLRLESGLERDVSLMLDLDPRIIEITSQPFTLELQSNKLLSSRQHHVKRPGIKPRFYTPDFLCKFDDGSLIAIDAKHSKFVEEFESKRNAVVLGLRQHGIGFSVILDTAVCPVVMSTVEERDRAVRTGTHSNPSAPRWAAAHYFHAVRTDPTFCCSTSECAP